MKLKYTIYLVVSAHCSAVNVVQQCSDLQKTNMSESKAKQIKIRPKSSIKSADLRPSWKVVLPSQYYFHTNTRVNFKKMAACPY